MHNEQLRLAKLAELKEIIQVFRAQVRVP